MIVNLNTLCTVQLNEFGKSIWLSQINNIPEEITIEHPEIIDNITNSIDIHGNLTLELWNIMNIFGPYISMTSMPFTETTINIDKNPKFK